MLTGETFLLARASACAGGLLSRLQYTARDQAVEKDGGMACRKNPLPMDQEILEPERWA